MQGPTHVVVGIACQKATDRTLKETDKVLHNFLPKRISVKKLRWIIIPAFCLIFAHGFFDIFTGLTFHSWNTENPAHTEYVVFIFFVILTIWLAKKFIIRDWKNLKIVFFWKRENRLLRKKYKYFLPLTFGWLIPDGEHLYNFIRTGDLHSNPEFSYPLHHYATFLWYKIPNFEVFLDSLPRWINNGWAFFVELGVIVLFLVIIYLLSRRPRRKEITPKKNWQKYLSFAFQGEE